jgi:hypothetical protein
MEQQRRITCPKCGTSGPYRPEMAGKKLRCKCGNLIEVPPANAPPADAPAPPEPSPPPHKRPIERPADVVAYQSAPMHEEKKPSGPAYPSAVRPRTYMPEGGANRSPTIKIIALSAIALVLITGAFVTIHYLGNSHAPAPTGPQLAEDADIETMLQDDSSKEVYAWFKEDGARSMGPWNQQQAQGQVERWKQMGAKNVFAVGQKLSRVAIIELPADPAKRRDLFDWQAQWHRDHFEKIWTDIGQKYLMIRLGM